MGVPDFLALAWLVGVAAICGAAIVVSVERITLRFGAIGYACALAGLTIGMALGIWAGASAEDESNWTLLPEGDYFNLNLQPGETFSGAVILSNLNTNSINLNLGLVSAENALGGGFALASDRGNSLLLGWTQFVGGRIHLEPGETLRFPFDLSLPSNTPQGWYAGGFVAWADPENFEGDGIAIRMITRIGIALRVRVGDPQSCSLEFERVEASRDVTAIFIRNAGNTLERPSLIVNGRAAFSFEDVLPGRVVTHVAGHPINLEVQSDKDAQCKATWFETLGVPSGPIPEVRAPLDLRPTGIALLVAGLVSGVILIKVIRTYLKGSK